MRSRPIALTCAVAVGSLVLASCESLWPARSPGERLWRKYCSECHGLDARGNTVQSMGDAWADLRDDSWHEGGDPASIESVIRQGVFGKMPAHDELTRDEMRQLVDYLYRLRGETRG